MSLQLNNWLQKGQVLAERHQVKIRFLFAGILNTAFGLGTFPVLYYMLEKMKLHYLIILTISQVICISFSFLTNKFLVFRTKGNYVPEILKFITFHLSYFIVNLFALPILVELFHFHPVIAQTLFAGLVIASSYFWHSRITFFSK